VTPRAARRRRAATTPRPARRTEAADAPILPANTESEVSVSNLTLHQLFEQQAADLLERVDLDEEQKQSILLAMSCPCCGGGPSFSFKLKRRSL
jgi:hypothetical protein